METNSSFIKQIPSACFFCLEGDSKNYPTEWLNLAHITRANFDKKTNDLRLVMVTGKTFIYKGNRALKIVTAINNTIK